MNPIVTKDFWDTETLILKWFEGNKGGIVLSILMHHHLNKLNEQRKDTRYRSLVCEVTVERWLYENPPIVDPTGILSETILRIVQGARKHKISPSILKVDCGDNEF